MKPSAYAVSATSALWKWGRLTSGLGPFLAREPSLGTNVP